MELIIYKPTDDQMLQAIEFNYAELKEELSSRLQKYQGLVYSDSEITLAKKDRAALNKFRQALENKRKEVKAQCLKPYEDFESKIKDLVQMLDDTSCEIDSQVKAYEQQLKDNKRLKIEEFYRYTVSDDLQKIMTLDRIWNERWLNVTYSIGIIQDEIMQATDKVVQELAILDELDSPYKDQIKLEYLRSLDLGKAMQEGKRREAEAQRLREYEERKKAEAEQLAAAREHQRPEPPIQEIMPAAPAVREEAIPVQDPGLEWIAFRLLVTPEQKTELKQWIIDNKIRCTKA